MSKDSVTKADLAAQSEGLRSIIHENTRDLLAHQQQSLEPIRQSMDEAHTKLDALAEDMAKVKLAVVDLLATDRHIHNLVRELKAQNIALDESKIFAA